MILSMGATLTRSRVRKLNNKKGSYMLKNKLKLFAFLGLSLIGMNTVQAATNVYVTNQTDNSVSIIDLIHNQKLTNLSLPNGIGPVDTVVTPDGRFVFTANSTRDESGTISILDTSNYKIREINLSNDSKVANGLTGLAINKEGDRLWVVSIRTEVGDKYYSSLISVDLSSLKQANVDLETALLPSKEILIDEAGAHHAVVNAAGNRIYIAQYGLFKKDPVDPENNPPIFHPTNTIAVHDPVNNKTVRLSSKAFIGSEDLFLDEQRNTLYVVNQGPITGIGGGKTITALSNIDKLDLNQASPVDLDKQAVVGVKDLSVAEWPDGITLHNGTLYVTSWNNPVEGSDVITLFSDLLNPIPSKLEIFNAIDHTTDKYYDGLKARNRIYDIQVSADGKKIVTVGQPWYVSDPNDPEKLGSLYIIDHSVTQGKSGFLDLDGQRGTTIKKIETGKGSASLFIAKDVPLTLNLPNEITFTTKVNTPVTQKLTLSNNDQIVLHLLKTVVSPDVFKIESSTCKDWIIAGDICELTLSFNPTTVNTFNGSITLTTNADNGDAAGKLVVNLKGVVLDEQGQPGPVKPDPQETPVVNDGRLQGGGGGCSFNGIGNASFAWSQAGLFLMMIGGLFFVRRRQKN